jgi:hypothetical protein
MKLLLDIKYSDWMQNWFNYWLHFKKKELKSGKSDDLSSISLIFETLIKKV